MGLTYFKRFRMDIDLAVLSARPRIPADYELLSWDSKLFDAHVEAKYLSFRDEVDAHVFPCLGEKPGCHRLMTEISRKPGFLPAATWLAIYRGGGKRENCGTIQGIRDREGMGAIQNLGVTPPHRGAGLGTALLLQSLLGFREQGVSHVHLEVTAENEGAIRLYRRLGFVTTKTVYKVSEVPCFR